jgi:transposase
MVVVKKKAFHLKASQHFDNETQGFEQLMEWLTTLNPDNTMPIQVAIFCPSVYPEALVRCLKEKGIDVSLYNAQTANHQGKADLKEKKTDTLFASLLANLLIDGKFPLSQTPQENEYLEI